MPGHSCLRNPDTPKSKSGPENFNSTSKDWTRGRLQVSSLPPAQPTRGSCSINVLRGSAGRPWRAAGLAVWGSSLPSIPVSTDNREETIKVLDDGRGAGNETERDWETHFPRPPQR